MTDNAQKEYPNTYFVEDRSNQEELTRVQIQDQLLTKGMGGVFPEQLTLPSFKVFWMLAGGKMARGGVTGHLPASVLSCTLLYLSVTISIKKTVRPMPTAEISTTWKTFFTDWHSMWTAWMEATATWRRN